MTDRDLPNGFLDQARQAYLFSIENLIYSQAIFFGSIMVTQSGNSVQYVELFAKALYHDGQIQRAFDILAPFVNVHDSTHPLENPQSLSDDGRFLYAKCSYDLELFGEVVNVLYTNSLDGPQHTPIKSGSAFTMSNLHTVVKGPPGLLLLGKALEKLSDRQGALECYTKCVDICPIMLESYQRLAALSAENTKSHCPPTRFAKTYMNEEGFRHCEVLKQAIASPASESPPAIEPVIPPSILTAGSPARGRPPRSGTVLMSTPQGPSAKRRGVSPPSISKPPRYPPPPPVPRGNLWEFMHAIGSAIYGLEIYDTQSVIENLSRLQPVHYESAYVQGLLGRALFESGKFVEADSAFSSSLKASPSGIVDFIDYYSSVLWQMRKEIELAHLCTHGLRVGNRQRDFRLWIAVANSFSLQKDYESAIKCLNRSIQINPHYAYSHVLVGQEFFSLEKFDKAKQCYQTAIELDPRSYNAYWGLGQIFLKQEEYGNAKFQFVKALEINPKSSIVRYSLALVALALKENDLAYQQLSIAIELNPKNAPAFCQKGILELTVYGKTDLAKSTLEKALSLVPNEPVVHVLLGRIYATNSNMREEAMMCFNTALELMKGSKDHLGVKQCIEEIDVIGISS